MATKEQLKRAFREAYALTQTRNLIAGFMGRPNGVGYDYDVTARAGWVYVRIVSGDGTSLTQALNMANVPRKGNLPIWLDIDPEGQLITVGLRTYGSDTTIARLPVYPAYGELYVHDGAASQNFTTTPTKFTQFATAGPSFGCTVSAANDQITVLTDGLYHVDFNMTAVLENTFAFEFHVRVDGVEQPKGTREIGSGGAEHVGFSTLLELVGGEVVTIYGESGTVAVRTCDAQMAQLVVQKVAELK